MVVEFDQRFLLDVKQIHDNELRDRIKGIILRIEQATSFTAINNLKKLEKYAVYYRIKIKLDSKRDYRLGLSIRRNKATLIRCLPRTRIYKKFP